MKSRIRIPFYTFILLLLARYFVCVSRRLICFHILKKCYYTYFNPEVSDQRIKKVLDQGVACVIARSNPKYSKT